MAEDATGQPEGDKKIVHTYPLVKVTKKTKQIPSQSFPWKNQNCGSEHDTKSEHTKQKRNNLNQIIQCDLITFRFGSLFDQCNRLEIDGTRFWFFRCDLLSYTIYKHWND